MTCRLGVIALLTVAFLGSSHLRAQDELSGDALKVLLEKARAEHNVPALAAGVLRSGQPPLAAVVGVRRRGDDDNRVTDADQWHLLSNCKPITALLIALLVDLGLLDWDTPLVDIFPEQAARWNEDLKKITPAHLLTHTSGLPTVGPFFMLLPSEGPPAKDRERLIASLGSLQLSSKPGEKYVYNNLGYVVLGAIIDKRGKESWEEQLEKKIIRPLDIKHWRLGPPTKKEPPEHPWPHQFDGKPADGLLDLLVRPVNNSAGRLRISVGDYQRFLGETLRLAREEKGMLKPETARKIFTNPHPVSPHSLSGWFGFRKEGDARRLVLRHDGIYLTDYCTAVIIPDRQLAICVMTNQGLEAGSKVCEQVRKLLGDKK